MRYRVWNPDEESEDDALQVLAVDVNDAAETFVASIMSGADTFDVMVANEDGDKYRVEVEVEIYDDPETGDQHPTFTCWPRKVVQ